MSLVPGFPDEGEDILLEVEHLVPDLVIGEAFVPLASPGSQGGRREAEFLCRDLGRHFSLDVLKGER